MRPENILAMMSFLSAHPVSERSLITAALVHAAVLGLLGWVGGSPHAPAVVAGLVASQILEGSVAVDRPDTADTSARAIGLLILAVVAGSLLVPGDGTAVGWVPWIAGLGLRLWAIQTLGPRFLDGVARLPGHVRSTDGPYRWFAHPADLGILAMTVGIVVILGSPVGGGVWIALAGLLGWRVRAEDRLWTTR